MVKDTKNTVTVDGVEFNYDDLSDKAKVLVQHVADLERKLATAKFNVEQLEVGHKAFFDMLRPELPQPPKEGTVE